MRRTSALLLAALSVLVSSTGARADAPLCFGDWSAARAIVKREGLVTVETLVRQAPEKLGGEIVRSTLCQDGSSFTYRLVVRDPSGAIRQVIVDAREPFGP